MIYDKKNSSKNINGIEQKINRSAHLFNPKRPIVLTRKIVKIQHMGLTSWFLQGMQSELRLSNGEIRQPLIHWRRCDPLVDDITNLSDQIASNVIKSGTSELLVFTRDELR
jgi:hypothetical protein